MRSSEGQTLALRHRFSAFQFCFLTPLQERMVQRMGGNVVAYWSQHLAPLISCSTFFPNPPLTSCSVAPPLCWSPGPFSARSLLYSQFCWLSLQTHLFCPLSYRSSLPTPPFSPCTLLSSLTLSLLFCMIPHCLKTVRPRCAHYESASKHFECLHPICPAQAEPWFRKTDEAPDLIAPVTLALTPWQLLKQAY